MGSAWHESDRPYAIGHRLDRRPYSKSVPTDLGCAPGPRAQAVARHTSKEHARTALEKVIDVHVEIGEAACVRDGRTRGDAEFAVPSFATHSHSHCGLAHRVTGSSRPGRPHIAMIGETPSLTPCSRTRGRGCADETRDSLNESRREVHAVAQPSTAQVNVKPHKKALLWRRRPL